MNNCRRAVLITGCSSGIGQAIARHLAQEGYLVLATVRRAADAELLRSTVVGCMEPVFPVDLTLPEQVELAIRTVIHLLRDRGVPGLYALVNNAGAGTVAPIELLDPERLRRELEIRVLAPICLLQGLLPLLRKGQGRVLWIVTPGLLPIPYIAGIHAADYAVNCIARTLHLELRPWGVPSILIRCGGIETPAAKRVALELARDLAHWPAAQRELYAEALCKLQTQLGSFDRKRTSPGVVAQKVAQALAARRPKRSYLVGHLANWAAFAEMLPQGLVDAVLARLSAGARRCFEEADPPRRPPDRRSD